MSTVECEYHVDFNVTSYPYRSLLIYMFCIVHRLLVTFCYFWMVVSIVLFFGVRVENKLKIIKYLLKCDMRLIFMSILSFFFFMFYFILKRHNQKLPPTINTVLEIPKCRKSGIGKVAEAKYELSLWFVVRSTSRRSSSWIGGYRIENPPSIKGVYEGHLQLVE